jgi:uncharacterized membrane protein
MAAAMITLVSYLIFSSGHVLMAVTSDRMADIAKETFSASVSLLGLVSATVAFVFSAIDSEKLEYYVRASRGLRCGAYFHSPLFACLSAPCGVLE